MRDMAPLPGCLFQVVYARICKRVLIHIGRSRCRSHQNKEGGDCAGGLYEIQGNMEDIVTRSGQGRISNNADFVSLCDTGRI